MLSTYKQCAHNQWTNSVESSHQETSPETQWVPCDPVKSDNDQVKINVN